MHHTLALVRVAARRTLARCHDINSAREDDSDSYSCDCPLRDGLPPLLGILRDTNTCSGCLSSDGQKADSRTRCRIKNCEHLARGKSKYCSDRCGSFPCARLKQLDKRYRTKYGMSMIENLVQIREVGIRQFVRNEKAKWLCPRCGELICVHKPTCVSCGRAWR